MNATPSQIYAAHLPQHLRSFELSCEIKAYNGYTKSASPPRAYTASHQPAPLQNSRSSLHYRNRFPTRASISTINAGSISTSTSTSRPPLPLPLLNLHPPFLLPNPIPHSLPPQKPNSPPHNPRINRPPLPLKNHINSHQTRHKNPNIPTPNTPPPPSLPPHLPHRVQTRSRGIQELAARFPTYYVPPDTA